MVETSGEYIDYRQNQEEIDALLAEIAELREENLEVRKQIASVIVDFRSQEEATQTPSNA